MSGAVDRRRTLDDLTEDATVRELVPAVGGKQ